MRKLDREEQREAIATVAAQLIADLGVKQVTIQQIAAAFGGTKGKVLHYFDSKEEIIEAAFAWANRRGMERLEEFWNFDPNNAKLDLSNISNLLPLDPQTDLEWRVHLHYWEYALTDSSMRDHHFERVSGQLNNVVELVEKFQKNNLVRSDVSAEEIAYTTFDSMNGLGFSLLYYPMRKRAERISIFVDYVKGLMV